MCYIGSMKSSFFRKKEKKFADCQRSGAFGALAPGFTDYLYRRKNYDLAAHQALEYDQRCAPLADALTLIEIEVAAIEPAIFDKEKNVFIHKRHPILDLLENPNALSTYEDFIIEVTTFYLLNANSFINADGPVDRPPISINSVPTYFMTPVIASDGYVGSWDMNSAYVAMIYFRKMVQLRFRYYNKIQTSELYQIRGFGSQTAGFKIWGQSQLNPLWYEIEQYIAASVHNLSQLEKGATISGVFSTENMLSDDSYSRLRAELINFYSGAGNAGRSIVLENGLNFKEASQSNKDMDFANLKDKVTMQIYKNLKIPLPLVNESVMTLANLEASSLLLYDNAVLPLAKRIFSELTRFLMPRYPNSENLILWFDDSKISALEPRRLTNLKQKVDLGVLTTNEIRADIQLPPFSSGGDELYQAANLIPYTSELK